MKIVAASIAEAADRFLHAGYISAYPSTFYGEELNRGEPPALTMDMVESLRLQGESLAAGSHGVADVAVASLGGVGSPGELLMGAAALAGGAAMVWFSRKTGRVSGAAVALAAAMGAGAMVACQDALDAPLPTEAPWEGVEIREYADPEAATMAILHGLVAPALHNMSQEVSTLPNIQYEVGLPAKDLTEGMDYAITTYGLDGWGRPMTLEASLNSDGEEGFQTGTYTVTSAGPDGEPGTADDLSLEVPRGTEDWEWGRVAYYLAPHEGELLTFFHRWTGWRMEYRNEDVARGYTGTDLFDFLSPDDLPGDEARDLVQDAWDSVADPVDHEPLVLMVL